MKPISTTLEGIGAYPEPVTINWAELRSPIAITGVYGTGKTWIFESPFAAAFGHFAWYSGTPPNLYQALTLGGNGRGRIAMTFEHGGEIYHVERIIRDSGKTRTQKATLKNAAGDMIAGPKVGDVDATIQAMLGSKETALATWLLSQSRTGDLCGQPGEPNLVARRRDVFTELIGGRVLDAIEERFGKVARKTLDAAEELEAQLAGEEDLTESLTCEKGDLNDAEDGLADVQPRVISQEQNLELARTKLRDAEAGEVELRAQVTEHERCEKAVKETEERIETLSKELETATLRAAGLEKAAGEVERLNLCRRRRGDLREEEEKFKAWQTWDWRRQELEKSIAAGEQTVSNLEAFPGRDEETKALAKEIHSLRIQYTNALARNCEIEKANREFGERLHDLETDLNATEIELERLDAEIAEEPETLFGEKCKPCPQIKKWAALPERKNDFELQKVSLLRKIAAVPDCAAVEDLADLIARIEQAKAAAKSVQEVQEREPVLSAARSTLEGEKALLREHNAAIAPETDDPAAAIREAQEEIDVLAGAPERVQACEQAAHEVTRKGAELAANMESLELLEVKAENSRRPAESAKAVLANRETQRTTLREEVETLDAKVEELRGEVERLTREIAKHEARIEELERRQREQAEKRARVKLLRDKLSGLKDLRLCFGTRGVRQILIDNAVPELEDIANDLFDRATDGKLRLRIATQKVLQDDSIAEDFSILVTDHRGERDVTRYSGGELQLNRILFRSAQALWVGRLRGQQADCLFLDEAFDQLGDEGTEDLMRALDYLGDQIEMLVIVTHDSLNANRMRSQIRLSKAFGGVTVETN